MHSKRFLLSAVIFLLSVGLFAPALSANPEYDKEKSYGAAPVHLVASFEDLLHRQEKLLHSFESLVNLYHQPPVELLKSYEDLLRRQALLLGSFEELVRPYACGYMHPEFKLIKSFEMLLHGQAKLLMSFEGLLHKLHKPQIFFIESFEDLLRRQAKLVGSFEGLLHCLAEKHRISPRDLYGFLTSFEDLIRSQAKLLMSFESLVKGTAGHHLEKEPYKHGDGKHDGDKDSDEYGGKHKDDDYDHKEISDEKPYHHDEKSDEHHDGYDNHGDYPKEKHHGYDLPELGMFVEFAKHGAYMVKHGHLRELFVKRDALTERAVAMIQGYKNKIAMLHEHGKHEAAMYAMKDLDHFRLELSKLQTKIIKHGVEVTLAPMHGDDHHYGYDKKDKDHHDKDEIKLIVSNNTPFTINMASLAVTSGYKVLMTMSLGTLEAGEHRVIKIRAADPYMAEMIEKNLVVTGFIQMFSKLFQAAMME